MQFVLDFDFFGWKMEVNKSNQISTKQGVLY